ncbi:F-type H+-transporting ATPase subunit a [Methylomarinovum caldicuralii]|uniref:ATP synthase subunit a n=1 Tax=Methylomarinovum caldicuralii TaxID=438856 RepID=A0AAU9CAH5_9GAMM|nr:F-type H+-transporting ATPase subunit a [Methylomarinovum caldicuralii]
MQFNPDQIVLWQYGPFKLSATLLFTWGVMALLVLGSWLATRRIRPTLRPGRWQNFLEALVEVIRNQIREVTHQDPDRYLWFVGTLFLFIALSNLLAPVPGYLPPTASLSTTTALALCVFVAVPWVGIREVGLKAYLRQYLEPHPLMLPFNVIGEFSRTLALAVRLYGNLMSGAVIGAVLITLVPFFFPVVMQLLGLLTGFIQAYIFAILALVYIASGCRVQQERRARLRTQEESP